MLELIVAWSVFTFLLGKSVQGVASVVTGRDTPWTKRRLAKLEAQRAQAQNADAAEVSAPRASPAGSPRRAGGFLSWLREVWDDRWIEAAERHRERWPEKARRARERKRKKWANRDQAVDETLGRFEQRWERRKAERDEEQRKAPEGPEEDLGSSADDGADPATPDDGQAPEAKPQQGEEATARPEPEPPPDTSPPLLGGDVLPFPDRSDTGSKGAADPMASDTHEVIGLSGATRFTQALVTNYRESSQRLENTVAAMRDSEVGDNVIRKFARVQDLTEAITAAADNALKTCYQQLEVRDAYAAAPDAGSKEFVTKS